MIRKFLTLSFVIFVALFLTASCSYFNSSGKKAGSALLISDIKMAKGVDKNAVPFGVSSEFNQNDSVIYNWFYYENALPDTKLEVVWFFGEEDIISYFVDVDGSGIRHDTLRMPDGKLFPAGKYMVEIYHQNKAIKNIFFSVV